MRRLDIYKLYNDLSKEYRTPMPIYILYQGNVKVSVFQKYVGPTYFMKFDSEISGVDDPFGIIFLSCTTPISSAIHEFFHYYDHFWGNEENEELTQLRTKDTIVKKNLKNAGKFMFTSETTIDQIINDIKRFALWIIRKIYFAFTLIVPSWPPTGKKQTNASSDAENSSSN